MCGYLVVGASLGPALLTCVRLLRLEGKRPRLEIRPPSFLLCYAIALGCAAIHLVSPLTDWYPPTWAFVIIAMVVPVALIMNVLTTASAVRQTGGGPSLSPQREVNP